MKKFTLLASSSIVLFLLLAHCIPTKSENLSLHPLFTDHMVLQQQQHVPIWGENEPNSAVSIKASWGAEGNATTDADGHWKINLTTPAAGGPFKLELNSGEQRIFLTDVMIGEVWLASGQSNMEMPLTGFLPKEPVDNYEQEIADANYPEIRMFTVTKTLSLEKKRTLEGTWKVCKPDNAQHFSATAYFFARKLHQELKVPIGIINSSWGGTVAEAWTSKEGLKEFPNFHDVIASFNKDAVIEWAKQFKSMPEPNGLVELEKLDTNATVLSDPKFDDSAWSKTTLPLANCSTDVFIPEPEVQQSLHGSFWYRKQITLTDTTTDYTLTIGAVDDADITYFNGQKIGSTWSWNKERVYTVPKSILRKGTNTIAINQYDRRGGSAINGPINLTNENGESISLEGAWNGFLQGDIFNGEIIMYDQQDQSKMKNRPSIVSGGPNELPSSLYNGMIHPLLPYTIKGAVWYQGESNVGRAEEYKKLFPSMITSWRSAWGNDFPFYFVQIAPFTYGGDQKNKSQQLREAQRLSLSTKNTGMAVAMDIGHATSIHPGNKQDIGDRLARLALANDYAIPIIAKGPTLKSYKNNGKLFELAFDNIESGLILKEGSAPIFEIAGADKKFFAAKAEVKGDVIELSSERVNDPKYARYGWKDYVKGTLFNGEGLPASSFTTAE